MKKDPQLPDIQELRLEAAVELTSILAPAIAQATPSRTLQRDMQAEVDVGSATGIIGYPYFWAVWLHDGRGPVARVRGMARERSLFAGNTSSFADDALIFWREGFKHLDPRIRKREASGNLAAPNVFQIPDYPRKREQQRRLTRRQWKAALQSWRRDKEKGRDPRVVITRKPTGSFEGYNWLKGEETLRAEERAVRLVSQQVAEKITEALGSFESF